MIRDIKDFYLSCPFYLNERLEKSLSKIILCSILSQKDYMSYDVEEIEKLLVDLGFYYNDECEMTNYILEYNNIKDVKICITLVEEPKTAYSKYMAFLYMSQSLKSWIPLPISGEINKRNLSLILAEDNPELTIDASVMVKDLIMQMFDREIVHSFKEMGSILKEFNDYTSQVGQKYIQKQKSPEAIEE